MRASPYGLRDVNERQPNVIQLLGAQVANGPSRLQIFLTLYDGNLDTLYHQGFFKEQERIKPLFHQMLQALDYLDTQGIIHRDIKPENILYRIQADGTYLYVLSDFGVSNITAQAVTFAGSLTYMAPEVTEDCTVRQTSKVDIWSLFVTIGSLLNLANFNKLPKKPKSSKLKAVALMAAEPTLNALSKMVHIDPSQRPSAAELLDGFFNGEGRISPNVKRQQAAPAVGKRKPEERPKETLTNPAGIRKRTPRHERHFPA